MDGCFPEYCFSEFLVEIRYLVHSVVGVDTEMWKETLQKNLIGTFPMEMKN